MIGGLNFLFGYSCYAFFIYLNMSYSLALLCSTCLGVIFNFKTTGQFVFSNTNNKYLLKFIVVYGFIYFFNVVFIKFLDLLISNHYLSGILVMIPAALLAFILNKYIVFKEGREIN